MALNSDVTGSLTTTSMLSAVSCANTAAATQGTGTDISAHTATTVTTMMPPAVLRKPFSRVHATDSARLGIGSW